MQRDNARSTDAWVGEVAFWKNGLSFGLLRSGGKEALHVRACRGEGGGQSEDIGKTFRAFIGCGRGQALYVLDREGASISFNTRDPNYAACARSSRSKERHESMGEDVMSKHI